MWPFFSVIFNGEIGNYTINRGRPPDIVEQEIMESQYLLLTESLPILKSRFAVCPYFPYPALSLLNRAN